MRREKATAGTTIAPSENYLCNRMSLVIFNNILEFYIFAQTRLP